MTTKTPRTPFDDGPPQRECRGLYAKFKVERLWGSTRGIVHDHCQYFVLDITHDPHARNAALAYAESCEPEYPGLAIDLRAAVSAVTDLGPRPIGSPPAA